MRSLLSKFLLAAGIAMTMYMPTSASAFDGHGPHGRFCSTTYFGHGRYCRTCYTHQGSYRYCGRFERGYDGWERHHHREHFREHHRGPWM